MKFSLSERLPAGQYRQYQQPSTGAEPALVAAILQAEGVLSIYHAADFLAVERAPSADWRDILVNIKGVDAAILQRYTPTLETPSNDLEEQAYRVYVQTVGGCPLQLKLCTPTTERRFAMPDAFVQAGLTRSHTAGNVIHERIWEDYGPRYGFIEELGQTLIAELSSQFADVVATHSMTPEPVAAADDALTQDWQARYRNLLQTKPSVDTLGQLIAALRDPHSSVRRLAVVLIAEVKDAIAFSYLFKALRDPAVSVRRTAGDSLSDLADPVAVPFMMEALRDAHKLVRWRAARFLYEVGDERAVAALQVALADAEFEVSFQARLALERIAAGEQAAGSIWQQMARRNDSPEESNT
jgi:hypothetical protein